MVRHSSIIANAELDARRALERQAAQRQSGRAAINREMTKAKIARFAAAIKAVSN